MVASTPEVEWDDTERAWMLALAEYRTGVLCPCGCGWPREISQDPMTEMRAQVPPPVRCHVRTRLARAQEEHRKNNPDTEMSGLLWGVTIPSD